MKLLQKRLLLNGIWGEPIELPLREAYRRLGQPNSVAFFAMVALALFGADPAGLRQATGLTGGAFLWALSVALYLTFYCIQMALLSEAQSRLPWLKGYMAIMGAVALLPTIVIVDTLGVHLSQGLYEPQHFADYIYFYLITQAFEGIFTVYVYPQITAEDQEVPDEDRALTVAGERVLLRRVKYIEAREHFVDITLDGRVVTHRARLSDIVAQVAPEDGFQPHRSWWVSAQSGPQLERDGARYVLRLSDDTVIPVARGRVPDVQAWLATPDEPTARARV